MLNHYGVTFAGIGSRETPQHILQQMKSIARTLCGNSCRLRSGGARGADEAFEEAYIECGGGYELYLPWKGYERKHGMLPTLGAFDIAAKYHPRWNELSSGARLLHARNSHIILGRDLDTPVKFVVCWTSDGKASGGTGQGIRIAKAYNIPVFNLFEKKSDTCPQSILPIGNS
jgi:hypothetical protein